jgi:polysaccharide export outer membrane protein
VCKIRRNLAEVHMRRANRLFLIFSVSFALTCAAQAAQKKSKQDSKAQPASNLTDPAAMAAGGGATIPASAYAKTYIIGAEDVLNITITTTVSQSSSYPVRPDGVISVPLIGEVMAAGLTPSKLEEVLTKSLVDKKLFVEPNVTVGVVQFNSRKVYITGDGIAKPGPYSLIVPTTVSQLLAQAGSFRDFANKKDIRIMRNGKVYHYNDEQVSNGKHMEQDIFLEPGDHIYVK